MEIKGIRVTVVQGDLTEQEVTAIVNAANNQFRMGGGVAGAIRKRGGAEIEAEAVRLGPKPVGEAVVTAAGRLPCRYVIHAATMAMDFVTGEESIRLAARNALKRVREQGMESVAFPALGCGVGGFPAERAARIMAEETAAFLCEGVPGLREVRFVLFDAPTFWTFEKVVGEHLGYIQRKLGRYPIPTVDAVIETAGGIVLIERKNPPYGWALPGGFVDWGESLEAAVRREAMEETGLELEELRQFHTYSEPGRDPRFHTITTVFSARGRGEPVARDDAAGIAIFPPDRLPEKMAFDHRRILRDYLEAKFNPSSTMAK